MNGILTERMNDVYACVSLEQAKALVRDIVTQSDIPKRDRIKMLITSERCVSLPQLWQYITNSWFVYNGMGVK